MWINLRSNSLSPSICQKLQTDPGPWLLTPWLLPLPPVHCLCSMVRVKPKNMDAVDTQLPLEHDKIWLFFSQSSKFQWPETDPVTCDMLCLVAEVWSFVGGWCFQPLRWSRCEFWTITFDSGGAPQAPSLCERWGFLVPIFRCENETNAPRICRLSSP